jgi:hypothetical protein
MDVTSPKILTGLACVLALGLGEVGCGLGMREGYRPGTTSTTSVHVSLSPVHKPLAPRGYRVPRRALHVSSSQELVAALADHRRETIVLARGVYDNSGPFLDRDGDRIYAAQLGRAVLRAGIVLGSNDGPPGALIRGLTFSVADPAKTLDGDIVHVWGSASSASVLDTRLDGHGAVGAGLVVRQPNGFVGRRIVARRFQSYGVVVDPNDTSYQARTPFSLRDLTISRVSRPVPGSSNGRAEACLWLGSPGKVRRVSVGRCAISGIWTGTATHGSRIEDAFIQRSRVGIYIEHFTTNTTFERLRVGPGVSRGVNAEWANHVYGGKPASVDNVIQNAYFRTGHVGVYLDQGTTRTLIRHCVFAGQDWAGIGDYLGVANEYYDNDFAGIAPGAVAVSYDHDPGGGGR